MNTKIYFMIAVCLGFLAAPQAQVPWLVTHQGGVARGGTNYQGVGHFKFAFISGDASKTYWSNDSSSENGREPVKSIPLAVTGGAYEVMLGDTAITNMTAVPPTVFNHIEVYLRVWFSDGATAFQPVQPDQRVSAVGYAMMAAKVANGAVTAEQLAEGAVTAGKLAPNAVTAAKIAPGAIGQTQLAPNTAAANLSASGGLVLSDQEIATNLIQAGFRKIGTVQAESDRWLTNTPYYPLGRANHAAVWTGKEMVVLGGAKSISLSPLQEAGARYNPTSDSWASIKLSPPNTTINSSSMPQIAIWTGQEIVFLSQVVSYSGLYNPETGVWRSMTNRNAPTFAGSMAPSAVWTGHELLVWGGLSPSSCHHRYDPVANRWTPMSTTNQPTTRQGQSAIWTGTEMIVWGGDMGGTTAGTGYRYNPATDTWKAVNRTGAPTARTGHSAAWTGGRMIVWGGQISAAKPLTATGGIYDPATDTWKPIGTNNAPLGRKNHVAIWTGSGMLVWGGLTALTPATSPYATPLNDGGMYHPENDTWSSIKSPPASAQVGQSAVWTGTELIVWGGAEPISKISLSAPQLDVRLPFNSVGWRYLPSSDEWRPTAFAPLGRTGHTAVWSGEEFIIWGGIRAEYPSISGLLDGGGRYNPRTGKWTPVSTVNAPTPRAHHRAVWTGTEMIVWGGSGVISNRLTEYTTNLLGTGARYHPKTDTWSRIETNSAPSPRVDFSMIWTGDELVIFGGRGAKGTTPATELLNTGARYNPYNNSWLTMSKERAPSPRRLHASVWTGKEMVVWSGDGSTGTSTAKPLDTGAVYDPILNAWTPMTTNGAPHFTVIPKAVWTGGEMIVLGSTLGGRYDPENDRWTTISMTGAPRQTSTTLEGSAVFVTATWTGREILMWGDTTSKAGGRYLPQTGTWTAMTVTGAPANRNGHTAAWTGEELLVFGGTAKGSFYPSDPLIRYQLSRPLYLYGRQ